MRFKHFWEDIHADVTLDAPPPGTDATVDYGSNAPSALRSKQSDYAPSALQSTYAKGKSKTQRDSNARAENLADLVAKIDPYMHNRNSDGTVNQGFAGTYAYAAPEMHARKFKPGREVHLDFIGQIAKDVAALDPQLAPILNSIQTAWENFKQQFQPKYQENVVHPIMFKSNILRINFVDSVIVQIKNFLSQSRQNSPLFNQFDQLWSQQMPKIKNYLTTAEQDARDKFQF